MLSKSDIERYCDFKGYGNAKDEHGEVLDDCLQLYGDDAPITLLYKTSKNAKIDILGCGDEDRRYIIWDAAFWDFFSEFLFLCDETEVSPETDEAALLETSGFLLASVCNYLSHRYCDKAELAKSLSIFAQEVCKYKILSDVMNDWKRSRVSEYELKLLQVKVYTIFHERAHFKMAQDGELLSFLEEQFNSCLDLFKENEIRLQTLQTLHSPAEKKATEKLFNRGFTQKQHEDLLADYKAYADTITLNLDKNNSGLAHRGILHLHHFIVYKTLLDETWDSIVKGKYDHGDWEPERNYFEIARNIICPNIRFTQSQASSRSLLFELSELNNLFYDYYAKILYLVLDKHFYSIVNNSFNRNSLRRDSATGKILLSTHRGLVVPLTSSGAHLEMAINEIERHFQTITNLNSEKTLEILFTLANNFRYLDSKIAEESFLTFIERACDKHSDNYRYICDAYSKLALIKAEEGKITEAKEYLGKAVSLVSEQNSKALSTAFLFNNIGNVFLALQDYKSANTYYLRSRDIRISHGDNCSLQHLVPISANISGAYLRDGMCLDALYYSLYAYRILVDRVDNGDPRWNSVLDQLTCISQAIKLPVELENGYLEISDPETQTAYTREPSTFNDTHPKPSIYRAYAIINEFRTAKPEEAVDKFIEIYETVNGCPDEELRLNLLVNAFYNFHKTLLKVLEAASENPRKKPKSLEYSGKK
jgi:tetratricopeptide (TPR) repeat protein